MDMKLREFRKQAGEENRGRRGLGRRYSGQLRLAAVAYLRRKKGEGASLERGRVRAWCEPLESEPVGSRVGGGRGTSPGGS